MECGLSEIQDLPHDALVQRQVVDANYVYAKPIEPVAGATEVDFYIKNNGDTFLDLANTEVEIIFRVKKGNANADLVAADKVSVINYIQATMFDTIDCWLGNELVTERTPNQAFRAMIETLTTYGRDAVDSWLQSALFFKDTAGEMDNANPAPVTNEKVNEGLKQRFEFTKESNRVAVRGRIHVDVFSQSRLMVNNVDCRLKFHLNKNEYCLMSDETDAGYKIVIEDVSLRLRHVKLADRVYKEIVTKTVFYPITRVKVKEYIIPRGGKSFNVANFVSGVLPQKIIMGMVTNNAANGAYNLNPFNFKHFNISQVSLVVNGSVHGGVPLEFDFANNQFEKGYWTLFSSTGKKYRDDGMMIQRNDYKEGYTLFAFNISPSTCNIGQYRDQEQTGNINIAFKFKESIPEPLTLCAYLQFEGSISINPTKQVTTNFQT